MRFSGGWLRFAVLLTGVVGTMLAAQPAPPPAPPEAHQFDFWIGEWTVTSPDGKLQGTSRVEPIALGRGLLENWTGNPALGGGEGKSLNTWNAAKHAWQQFWVGSGGGVLELSGALDAAGRMVLSGSHEVGGKTVVERITWTPNPDGSVRQLWEQSFDAEKTWQVAFDGHYAKTAK